ncbi:alpha/beta hydrolase [Alphaproteobacteria bacterium]|nr:alpha/beta hydrolase [Alphaproteobacteria bacterium]
MTYHPEKILENSSLAQAFFEGFEEKVVDVPGGYVFCRVAGEGTPLLLLHGYPQTSAMWHKIAPTLAQHYHVICADLRGYGRSCKPETDEQHSPYSKRAMANDLIALMDSLGHKKFLVGSHDRGGRVAHRLAYDHSDRVLATAILDIAPTREMYANATSAFANAYWHWYWLIQKAPLPEKLIGADPGYFWCMKCCSDSAGATPFDRQALEEYLKAFRDPKTIHSSCEDYRAAYSIDIEHDNAETTKLSTPLLVNWGQNGAIEAHFNCLELWRQRARNVQGSSLPGGHYLAEEVPGLVLKAWLPFFEEHSQ